MKSYYRKKGVIFLAGLLLAIVPAVSQSSAAGNGQASTAGSLNGTSVLTLTVDDAVKTALSNNETLKQSAIALEAKRRAAGISWNTVLPSMTVGAGVLQTNSDLTANGTTATTFAEIPVSVSLSLNASVPQVIEAAKLAYEGQLVAYEQAKQKLALSIRQSFYNILLDQAQLELAHKNIDRQQASFAQTESKYKAGLDSELDYLKAKVSLETLKPAEQGYAMTLQNDIDTFKNSLGLKPEDKINVTGHLDIEDKISAGIIEDALKRDTSANLSVLTAINALATAKVTATKTFNANYIPSLSLAGSVTPKYPISPSGSSTTASSLSAVVSISLDNYLPWSSVHEKMAEATDSVKTGESALADAIKTTQVSRLSYKRSAETYQSTLGVLKMNVDLTQRTYDATKTAYDKGLETMTDLLSAVGDLQTAQFNALSKSYSLIAALLALQYETGIPLDTTGRF